MRYSRYSQKPSIPLGPRRMSNWMSSIDLPKPRSLSKPGLIFSQISSLFKIPAQCASALSLPVYVDISSSSSPIGIFNPILWAASRNRSIIRNTLDAFWSPTSCTTSLELPWDGWTVAMMGNGTISEVLIDDEALSWAGCWRTSFVFFIPTSNNVRVLPLFFFIYLVFSHLLLPVCWLRLAGPAVPTLMSSSHSRQCAVVVTSYFILFFHRSLGQWGSNISQKRFVPLSLPLWYWAILTTGTARRINKFHYYSALRPSNELHCLSRRTQYNRMLLQGIKNRFSSIFSNFFLALEDLPPCTPPYPGAPCGSWTIFKLWNTLIP